MKANKKGRKATLREDEIPSEFLTEGGRRSSSG